MLEAAESLDFEWAAPLRDQVTRLHDSISKALTEVQEIDAANRKRTQPETQGKSAAPETNQVIPLCRWLSRYFCGRSSWPLWQAFRG